MKILKSLLITGFSLLLTAQVWSQSTPGATDVHSNKILTDKYGIRIFVSDAGNIKDGKLNFSNSTDKNTIIQWNVLDNNGKVSYAGSSITLAPKLTMSVPLNNDLQNALNGKDSSVQFIVKN